MADEAILQLRLRNIESDCAEIKTDVEGLDSKLDSISDRTQALEYWRDGNGARGAEARLQCLEQYSIDLQKANLRPRTLQLEADVRVLQNVTDATIMKSVRETVNDAMDLREKTLIAKLKAWGPIVAAICAFISSIIVAVVEHR